VPRFIYVGALGISNRVKEVLFYATVGAVAAAAFAFVIVVHLQSDEPTHDDLDEQVTQPIYVIPVGDVGESDVAFARDVVEASFGRETVVWRALPMQDDYYYAERGQYGASSLLRYLEANTPDDAYRAVGLTDVDIFMKGRNYVIGVARCPGRCAIVSTHRMGTGGVSEKRRLARIGKLLLHETGHTFGAHHCRQPTCAMDYAESVEALDGQRLAYCERCEKLICSAGGIVASERLEKLAAVAEKYGLTEELGADGLVPPPAPENLEWYELDY
jgi:archaemetzincin